MAGAAAVLRSARLAPGDVSTSRGAGWNTAHGTGRLGVANDTTRQTDDVVYALAMRALDAARSAGAGYADVRLTRTRSQRFLSGAPAMDGERIAVGVRALIDGCWGFAASPDWTMEEMARLGRTAATQAQVNHWGVPHAVQLGAPIPVASGTWTTPHVRDPFAVADEEKMDYIRAAEAYVSTFRYATASSSIAFTRQERTFASTDGAFCTQLLYTALGEGSYFSVDTYDSVINQGGTRMAECCRPIAGGYEMLTDTGLLDAIPTLYDDARRQHTAVPIRSGRYDVVFDAAAMAEILSGSIGLATEIDRVRGFEANAGGTSYLAPSESALGAHLYAPLLSVTANRSHPTGAASVRWDDDGVVPDDFTIVDHGVLLDYATSREHVTTLAQWYQSRATPLHSHGCAWSGSASDISLVHTPNLCMTPGAHDIGFEELVATVKQGVAVIGGRCRMDYRQLTGRGQGDVVYEIKNGALGTVLAGGSYFLRSPEFWNNVITLGGTRSLRWRGMDATKGEPSQQTSYSVGAVPALVRNVLLVNESGSSG